VLIVGQDRADLASPLIESGLSAEVSPGLFPAIAALRRHGARVVVIGHEEIEGRGANPVHAIRGSENATRVLLLHPRTDQADVEPFAGLGADEHLAEPCFPEQLVDSVQSLLLSTSGTGRRRETPEGPTPSAQEVLR
jgi:DNA-binding response OmpR family regulator